MTKEILIKRRKNVKGIQMKKNLLLTVGQNWDQKMLRMIM